MEVIFLTFKGLKIVTFFGYFSYVWGLGILSFGG